MKVIICVLMSCLSLQFVHSQTKFSDQVLEAVLSVVDKNDPKNLPTYCGAKVLQKLGWQFGAHKDERGDALLLNNARVSYDANSKIINILKEDKERFNGSACDLESFDQAVEMERLSLKFADIDGKVGKQSMDQFFNLIPVLVHYSTNSKCAYKFKMNKGVQASTALLSDWAKYKNTFDPYYQRYGKYQQYGFSRCDQGERFLTFPSSSWFVAPNSTFVLPLDSKTSSEALSELANHSFKTECAVGLQLAEIHSLWSAYKLDESQPSIGSANFDKIFNEVIMGDWDTISNSLNPFHGRSIDHTLGFNFANEGKLGKQGMIGTSGYIGNVKGERFLTKLNDRGENFLIVNISSSAAKFLAQGGLNQINLASYYAWSAARASGEWVMSKPAGLFGLFSIPTYTYSSNPQVGGQYLDKFPVFNEILVYVHPLGIMTLGDHIKRLLEVNRTEYSVKFYPAAINNELYPRYFNFHYQKCAEEMKKQGFFTEFQKPLIKQEVKPEVAPSAPQVDKKVEDKIEEKKPSIESAPPLQSKPTPQTPGQDIQTTPAPQRPMPPIQQAPTRRPPRPRNQIQFQESGELPVPL